MKRKILSVLSSIAILASFVVPYSAKATTISPPFFDYSLNPGDTVSDVIKVYNEGGAPITVYPIALNFTYSDDETGTPQFYPAKENLYGTALTQWMQFSSEPITLQPKARANLPFSITVPNDGQPGGHYGAILLSKDPPSDTEGSSVGLGSRLASIMLLNVSGEVVEKGTVEEFGFMNGKTIYTHLPVNFYLRFKNEGTTHLRPTGNAFIKNMFGRQSASIQVNKDFASVLPGSIRKFFFDWSKSGTNENSSELMNEIKNFGFGKYTASVVLTYGKDNKLAYSERTFWVIPWMLIIVAFIVLVILWFMLKLYNRSVVKTYERKKAKNE
jgi:hypothetical protein